MRRFWFALTAALVLASCETTEEYRVLTPVVVPGGKFRLGTTSAHSIRDAPTVRAGDLELVPVTFFEDAIDYAVPLSIEPGELFVIEPGGAPVDTGHTAISVMPGGAGTSTTSAAVTATAGSSVTWGSPVIVTDGPKTEIDIVFILAYPNDHEGTETERAAERDDWIEHADTIEEFYNECSYGGMDMRIHVTDWVDLDGDHPDYITSGSIDLIPNGFEIYGKGLQQAHAEGVDTSDVELLVAVIRGPVLRGGTLTDYSVDVDLGGGPTTTEQYSLSYVSVDVDDTLDAHPWSRAAHEIGHSIGAAKLRDLYDPSTTSPNGQWSVMDDAGIGGHVYAANKFVRLDWLESAEIETVTVGSAAVTVNPILHPAEKTAATGRRSAVQIKVTDDLYFWVEYRKSMSGIADQSLPDEGLVITKVVGPAGWAVDTGTEPIQILMSDKNDALEAGESLTISEATVDIVVTAVALVGSSPQGMHTRVEITPAPIVDLEIEPWSPPPWETPAIWIDSPANGADYKYNTGDPSEPIGNGDDPLIGYENTIHAVIENSGTVDVAEAEVEFYWAKPGIAPSTWHLIGTWHSTAPLAAGTTVTASVPWTPTDPGSDHVCLKAEITPITDEIVTSNNIAQENISHFATSASSPYGAISKKFNVTNPFAQDVLVYLLPNLPTNDWTLTLGNSWVLLNAGETKTLSYMLMPNHATPPGAHFANQQQPEHPIISISGWMPRTQDPVVGLLGGISVEARISERSAIGWTHTPIAPLLPTMTRSLHGRVATPAQSGLTVGILIEAPGGQRTVQTVTTRAGGLFDLPFVFTSSGTWKFQAVWVGDFLHDSSFSKTATVLVN